MSIIKVLPDLSAGGGVHMALDDGLLHSAENVLARQYTWSPPALSVGKFQRLHLLSELPFDVVRRPSGGRAVLHGDGFEWSFAVVFPLGALSDQSTATVDVTSPYRLLVEAFAEALDELGVTIDGPTESRSVSPFCFSSVMRHDLLARGEKIVAMAQARTEGHVLVHGSVLERRPPLELTAAAEGLLGERWTGEGLAGAGYTLTRGTVWSSVLSHLETGIRSARAST